MCDYSLHSVPNRLAEQGEELVIHRFPTGSIGMASARELRERAEPKTSRRSMWAALKALFDVQPDSVCAVCIPPGARLHLRDIPAPLQASMGVGPEAEVVFTEISAAAFTYRDAVRFENGRELRLQALKEGQRVTVLSLALEPEQAELELARRRARTEQFV